MAENTRAPVAIRIVRPYETEAELFANELETLGKTSVVLIGAHPRPTGVILRFEVTLANGETVLRGEGRVLAHKENAFRGQPGLSLRFTRLDPKSKSVVDRATALRESRAAGEGAPSRPAPPIDSPVADALTASTPAPSPASARMAPQEPEPEANANPNADQEAAVASARASAREKANATARANARRTGSARPMGLTPPPVPVAEPEAEPIPESEPRMEVLPESEREREPEYANANAESENDAVTSIPGEVAPIRGEAYAKTDARSGPEPEPVHAEPAPAPALARTPAARSEARAPIAAPPDRAGLLARLRERAAALPAERVQAILLPRR